jgi:hypothetical protein
MVGIENGKFYIWVQYLVFNIYTKLRDERTHIAHLNLIASAQARPYMSINGKTAERTG